MMPYTRQRGFTIIEATICLIIVGVMATASINLLGTTAVIRARQDENGLGRHLAQHLLSEIVQNPFEEANQGSLPPPTFGRELGETANKRTNWDDVDDYDGMAFSPPRQKSNIEIGLANGWTRKVFVEWVSPGNLIVSSDDTGLKRIRVQAIGPSGIVTELTALRSRYGLLEQPEYEDTVGIWTSYELQTGRNLSSRLVSGVAMVNHARHNLLNNPHVEQTTDPWKANTGCSISLGSSKPHSGKGYMQIRNRSAPDQGLYQDVTGKITKGKTYIVEGWAKVGSGQDKVELELQLNTSIGWKRAQFKSSTVGINWTKIRGSITPDWSGVLISAAFAVDTSNETTDLYLDDIVLAERQ